MNTKLNHQLSKIGMLIISISLFFTSCQKDEIEVQETVTQSKNASYGNVSFNEFSSRFDLNTVDQNVPSKFKTSMYLVDMYAYQAFSVNDNNNDYTIDTDVVKTASFDDKTTYSMKVVKDEPIPNTISNIIFEESPDGNITYILEFEKDAQTGEYLAVTKFDTAFNVIYSAPVSARVSGSIIFIDIIYFDCAAGHPSSCSTGDCDGCYSSQQFIVWNDSPGTGSSSGDTGSNTPVGDGSGSSNTGTGSSGNPLGDHPYLSSGSSTAIGIVDNDTTVDEDIQNAQAFYASLSVDQKAWANSNQFEYVNLVDYLLEDFNDENQEFFKKVIDSKRYLKNDIIDLELKILIEINETLEFQNQTCLKSIKDDVVSTGQMSKIIKKFEPTHPVLHLEWGMFNNTEWGNTGNTGLNAEQDTAFINLNSESLSHVTNIVMAKTIAHELIHAELYRKLKELVDDYNIISLEEYNALQDNFMGIAEYTHAHGNVQAESNGFGGFIYWGLDPDYSLAHHNQMAAFYRQTLIDVMKAYDLSKGITRTNATEFYEALSWAGLRITSDENGENSQYTDAWKNFKDVIDISEADIPENERTYNRYITIINQEYNNTGINCN